MRAFLLSLESKAHNLLPGQLLRVKDEPNSKLSMNTFLTFVKEMFIFILTPFLISLFLFELIGNPAHFLELFDNLTVVFVSFILKLIKNHRLAHMKTTLFVTVCIFLSFSMFASNLQAQDSTGFIDSLSRSNTYDPNILWQENWFDGTMYNFNFVDNFAFTYKYYGFGGRRADSIASGDGFSAVMGDLSTTYRGPSFALFGYSQEDDKWCCIPAVLSPQYLRHWDAGPLQRFWVDETWYSWIAHWTDPPIPTYLYEETQVNHDYFIWARMPPDKLIQLHYVADAFSNLDYEFDGEFVTATNITVSSPLLTEDPAYYGTLEEYMESASGLRDYIGEFNAGNPAPPPGEEPPGWAKGIFEGWIKPDDSDGKDWLPEPGSKIGLLFSYVRTERPATALVRYNIFRISTWQGECMNYPVDAPLPVPVPTEPGTHFDFTVVDTAKYDIIIHDYDTADLNYSNIPHEGFQRNEGSIRRYCLSLELEFTNADTIQDILWLEAHDYGAKAIVSPVTGQTWKDLMNMRETAFGQKVWSVSVPRDDDGQKFTGYNWGDYVADAWEEKVLGVAPGNPAVYDFVPFYQKSTTGFLFYTDQDTTPAGRNINGDGFCNWEEYRGFLVAGDQNGYYGSNKHMRLDPSLKNVMVHFIPGVEIQAEAPGYIDALQDTMAFIVEYIPAVDTSSSRKLRLRRPINNNSCGAHFPYYSAYRSWNGLNWGTTSHPADGPLQNAVAFWPMRNRIGRIHPWAEGYIKPIPRSDGDTTYAVPNRVYQCVVRTDVIDAYYNSSNYYQNHQNDWTSDRLIIIKAVLAHEFGHNIGMEDLVTNDSTLMGWNVVDPTQTDRIATWSPYFVPQYGDPAKQQITIKDE